MVDGGLYAGLAAWCGEVMGVPCEYGEFPPGSSPVAMVKVAPGTPTVRLYRTGGGVYRVPYEVYLRVSAPGQAGRVGGLETLGKLAEAIERREVPESELHFSAHELTSAPSLFMEAGGTASIYQLIASLTYVVTTKEAN